MFPGKIQTLAAFCFVGEGKELLAYGQRNVHELRGLGKVRTVGFGKAPTDMVERGAEKLPGAGTGADNGVKGLRLCEQELKEAGEHPYAIKGMGDPGNRKRRDRGEAVAQLHEKRHVIGEVPLVHHLQGIFPDFLPEAPLKRGAYPPLVRRRDEFLQGRSKAVEVMAVRAKEVVAVKGPIGEQRLKEAFIDYRLSHFVLPGGVFH